MSVILMEGPDGGGKTYAAKTAFPNHHYQHNGPPDPKNIFWWQFDHLVNSSENPNWIVDRSWPSEQIYHRFADRPHTFGPLQQRMFERFMLAHQGIVVMCLPSYATAYAEWRKRADEGKELLTRDADFAEMYYFYERWKSSVCTLHYDRDHRSADWLCETVWNMHRHLPVNPAPGIVWGNPSARILIVGEVYNYNKRAQGPHVPFVGMGRNGFWLSQQLEMLGLPERSLAWVNAYQQHGPTDIEAAKALPNVKLIVALGREAADWASRLDKPTLMAPHPSFWVRFKSKSEWPLLSCGAHLRATAGGL